MIDDAEDAASDAQDSGDTMITQFLRSRAKIQDFVSGLMNGTNTDLRVAKAKNNATAAALAKAKGKKGKGKKDTAKEKAKDAALKKKDVGMANATANATVNATDTNEGDAKEDSDADMDKDCPVASCHYDLKKKVSDVLEETELLTAKARTISQQGEEEHTALTEKAAQKLNTTKVNYAKLEARCKAADAFAAKAAEQYKNDALTLQAANKTLKMEEKVVGKDTKNHSKAFKAVELRLFRARVARQQADDKVAAARLELRKFDAPHVGTSSISASLDSIIKVSENSKKRKLVVSALNATAYVVNETAITALKQIVNATKAAYEEVKSGRYHRSKEYIATLPSYTEVESDDSVLCQICKQNCGDGQACAARCYEESGPCDSSAELGDIIGTYGPGDVQLQVGDLVR